MKSEPKIIFLCGFMGAGKSYLGRLLAAALNVPFADLDNRIKRLTGKEITQLFKTGGETGFRKMEREVLQKLIDDFSGVVALGGGSLQNQQLVENVKRNGLLIFIETPMPVIIQRIKEDTTRPMLLDESGNVKKRNRLKSELQSLYEERLPLYKQADLTVINDVQKKADEII